jgi:hypothetical protein
VLTAASRAALVSRKVVRWVVVVLLQEARRVTARRLAAILVIILFGLCKALDGIAPDGLYNYYISRPIGKRDFSHPRRIFANRGFP